MLPTIGVVAICVEAIYHFLNIRLVASLSLSLIFPGVSYTYHPLGVYNAEKKKRGKRRRENIFSPRKQKTRDSFSLIADGTIKEKNRLFLFFESSLTSFQY